MLTSSCFSALTADKHEQHRVIVDYKEDLLKGLFKVVETTGDNAKNAYLCLVNLSAKENGSNTIISFMNNGPNGLVYMARCKQIFIVNNLNVFLGNYIKNAIAYQ